MKPNLHNLEMYFDKARRAAEPPRFDKDEALSILRLSQQAASHSLSAQPPKRRSRLIRYSALTASLVLALLMFFGYSTWHSNTEDNESGSALSSSGREAGGPASAGASIELPAPSPGEAALLKQQNTFEQNELRGVTHIMDAPHPAGFSGREIAEIQLGEERAIVSGEDNSAGSSGSLSQGPASSGAQHDAPWSALTRSAYLLADAGDLAHGSIYPGSAAAKLEEVGELWDETAEFGAAPASTYHYSLSLNAYALHENVAEVYAEFPSDETWSYAVLLGLGRVPTLEQPEQTAGSAWLFTLAAHLNYYLVGTTQEGLMLGTQLRFSVTDDFAQLSYFDNGRNLSFSAYLGYKLTMESGLTLLMQGGLGLKYDEDFILSVSAPGGGVYRSDSELAPYANIGLGWTL